MTSKPLRAVALAAAALMLAGCAGGSGSPSQVTVVEEGLSLPMPYDQRPVLDPGWVVDPLTDGEVILGAAAADTALVFTAIAATGEPLWSQERPLSCSGFSVSAPAEARAAAILTDVETTPDAVAQTTAAGYDLATGDPLWGPVDVPGPHRGPGAVFSYAPKSVMGEDGPRLALDPATGEVAYDEGVDGGTLLGEYDGTLLVADGSALRALTTNQEVLWEVEADAWGGFIVDTAGRPALSADHALLQSASGGVLIDLRDGTALASHIDEARFDPDSGSLITLGETGLRSTLADGSVAWEVTAPDSARLRGAAAAFVYVDVAGVIHVHNAITGQAVQAYSSLDGAIVVPERALPGGAAILRLGEAPVLSAASGAP